MKKNRNQLFKYWFLSVFCKYNSSIKDSGYVLVIALGIIISLAGLIALYGKTSSIDKLTATATVDSNSGFYGAEAALNVRADQLRQTYLNYNQPTGTSPNSPQACFDGSSGNDGTGDFACSTSNYASSNTNTSGFSASTYIVAQNGGQATIGTVPNGDAFQGLNMQEYGHSIYALSFKDGNIGTSQGKQASAILQMDVRSRLIPMFQFAAFYTEDLEILPGPTMVLSGPVHTNGNLYLGANNTLRVRGQVTTVGDIFNYRKNNGNTYPDGRVQIDNIVGNPLNLLFNGTGSTSQTTNAMDPTRIATAWGPQILVNTNSPISIPDPGILDNTGQYYTEADIRIQYTPSPTNSSNMNYLNNIPFQISSIDRRTSSPVTTTLNTDQRRSLRQPVMVGADLASISSSSDYHVCTPEGLSGGVSSWWNGLTTAQKNNFRQVAQEFVQEEIQSQNAPLLLTHLDEDIDDIDAIDPLYNNFANNINNLKNDPLITAVFTTGGQRNTMVNNLEKMTPQQVAGLSEYTGTGTGTVVANTDRCYIAAPIMEVGRDDASHNSPYRFYNEREDRDIRILQMNLQSMAVWNRDGVYLNSGTLTSADNLLYIKAAADNSAPANSFQRLGLAAVDTSHGGIVIHNTIDGTSYPNAAGNQSPYGFAYVRGHQLLGLGTTTNVSDPTGVTIASDQVIHVQGHYNNVNYQPAAFLADSFTPLSEACITDDITIHHLEGRNCDDSNDNKIDPIDTTFNAALLAGTDITNAPGYGYNGGLENYPRFLERWTGRTWTYRGSFVSIGTPVHVKGKWGRPDVYTPPNRDWDYDTNFNDARNLPPLTPRFVYLKQESFIRSFEQ